MTFKEFMKEVGYDLMTTFWEDFSIADKYGIAGVKDTYKRAFSEWKDDYKFFTELTLVLNHKIWQHYESNHELAALYDRLWREADEYAMNNFKGALIVMKVVWIGFLGVLAMKISIYVSRYLSINHSEKLRK